MNDLVVQGRFVLKYKERNSKVYPEPNFRGNKNMALTGCLKINETLEQFIERKAIIEKWKHNE